MGPGQVTTVGSNKVWDVNPENDPSSNLNYPGPANYRGVSGFDAVAGAWNGGVLASNQGASGTYYLHGGGHAAYDGSEFVQFDLSTQMWTRSYDPYQGSNVAGYSDPLGLYPDDSPVQLHNYSTMQYDALSNRIYKPTAHGGTPDQSAQPRDYIHYMSCNDPESRFTILSPTEFSQNLFSGGWACIDPVRRRLFRMYSNSSTNFGYADLDTGVWTGPLSYSFTNIDINITAAYCPLHDLIVFPNYRNSAKWILALDMTRPDSTIGQWTILNESSGPAARTQSHGWEWSNKRQAFIYYYESSPNRIWELAPPANGDWAGSSWVWNELTFSGVTVESSQYSNGIFNKFRIMEFDTGEEVAIWNINSNANAETYAWRVP